MCRVRILEKAVVWYEQQRPRFGLEFGRVINAAFDLLEDEIIPLTKMSGEAGKQGVKQLTFNRFPYDIVIREPPEEIIVDVVAHQFRRPGYWRNRMRSC